MEEDVEEVDRALLEELSLELELEFREELKLLDMREEIEDAFLGSERGLFVELTPEGPLALGKSVPLIPGFVLLVRLVAVVAVVCTPVGVPLKPGCWTPCAWFAAWLPFVAGPPPGGPPFPRGGLAGGMNVLPP